MLMLSDKRREEYLTELVVERCIESNLPECQPHDPEAICTFFTENHHFSIPEIVHKAADAKLIARLIADGVASENPDFDAQSVSFTKEQCQTAYQVLRDYSSVGDDLLEWPDMLTA
eukprot:GABV01000673.1.p5 GENE.GABV01000673.1~~GABV01000673.1.p5  ORF type:complete len:116 (-),score=49.98 GABV01000673.1:71-418(-)